MIRYRQVVVQGKEWTWEFVAFEHNGQVWFWVPEQGEEPLPVDKLENVQREHIPYCRPQDQVIIHPVQVYPKDSNELHTGDLAQMAFQVEQVGMVQPTPPSKPPKRQRAVAKV